ncbi:hypothetical protein [Stenotrophomonas sp. SY1]|jgi:hypothetical protein|uniref:hypothetical protein n=1 Tax=Stenotrophomonas sp. SY1 TaxID=477235 RepID=UPI001E2B483F|nr:hypothetical protein [Stenotrophomonas sp. SY1]MCD9087222.1 hypothetical protein [Stenotrophomonas sp. SY1]
MRGIALTLGLLLAAGANAAPASRADVGRIMQELGMGRLGQDAATTLVGNVPQLQGLDAKAQACAATQASALMDTQFQQIVVDKLGADGQTLIDEWKAFLATPAGGDMARTFQASAAEMSGDDSAAGFEPGEASKEKIAAFMGTPAFEQFIGGFGDDSQLPEDIGQQLAEVLQRECQVALDPEQIS